VTGFERIYCMTQLPVLVHQKLAGLGEAGERWLAGLPDLIEEVRRQWSLTVGEPLAGGSAACVLRARTGDGRDAVLKLAIPGEDFTGQARTLGAAEGRGYARLLACDLDRNAMLLEALGPAMDLAAEPAIEALCQTLRQAWQVPRPAGLTVGEEKAGQLGRMVARLWESLGRPCSERVVEQALRFAEKRSLSYDLDSCVVVHGDPHPGNALRVLVPRAGAEAGFVFVDPDGFLCDPAYDLGVVLRDWCSQLLAAEPMPLARRYCRLLAAHSGIDETAIWEWGFLERVSTGLFILDLGAEELGRPFLDTAERLLPPIGT
jgi:streptomycin 6-kinase